MDEQQIRKLIKEELQALFGSDKYIFSKLIQIMDGRSIVVGKGVGTKIGTETTQKLSVYGVTPVVQAGAISSPAADTGELKTAVDALRTAIKNFGITA